MKMNEAMSRLVGQLDSSVQILSDGLAEILNVGFKVIDGCVLFSAFHEEEKLPYHDFAGTVFADSTGYEALENKFHVEDYCDGNHLEQALLFLRGFSCRWDASFGVAVVIIDIDPSNELGTTCTFRFHLRREGQFWVDEENLAEFMSPILVEEVVARTEECRGDLGRISTDSD